MEEIWKDIPGFEGYYMASNQGRIRSLDRVIQHKNGKKYHRKGKILKQYISNGGYYRIDLPDKSYQVSNLVALSFPEICGEYFDGAETDHINTIKTDNRPENLKWVDRKGNLANPITKQRQIVSHKGKCLGLRVNRKDQSKLVIKLSKDNEILHFYPSLMEAQRQTSIPISNIYFCCSGKRKTAGGYVWKYAE